MTNAHRLRLELKPMGTGIYPVRLLLTNTLGLDTRVVDLELTAQTMVQQFELVFDCAARQSITQVRVCACVCVCCVLCVCVCARVHSCARRKCIPWCSSLGWCLRQSIP